MCTYNDAKAKHFMVDIETLSLEPSTTVILSIGVVRFDKDGIYNTMKVLLPITTQLEELGRTTSKSTVDFWNRQPARVREANVKALPTEDNDIVESLVALFCFINQGALDGPRYVWAKDPDFDLVAIKSLAGAVDMEVPWKFYEPRSVRTILDLDKEATKQIRDEWDDGGMAHDALDDALCQARQVMHVFRTLAYIKERVNIMVDAIAEVGPHE
jgi:hypothetical protein